MDQFGFDEGNLAKDVVHTSMYSASMTNKIKDLHVYCNLVDASRNYSYSLQNTQVYNMSTQLVVIPIDTTQQLNGNFTEYTVGETSVPCRDDYYSQEIEFFVESGGHSLDYEIFLTLDLK